MTGSTRGIGRAVAEGFADEGATVVILGRQVESASRVQGEIMARGGKAEAYACDVSELTQVQDVVNKVLDKHKRVDILVNNAGLTKDNLLLRMTERDWDEVIRVNLKGVFNCAKVIARSMLKARQGRIINVSSIIGICGNAGQANYAASKAGIIGFTKSIAKEFASRGITANAIAPGYIQTDMTADLKAEAREEMLRRIPLGRLGKVGDIVGVCLFLASSEAAYITGQTIVVDGGLTI